jgi:hypothetical protein
MRKFLFGPVNAVDSTVKEITGADKMELDFPWHFDGTAARFSGPYPSASSCRRSRPVSPANPRFTGMPEGTKDPVEEGP